MEQTQYQKQKTSSSIICFAGSRYGSVPEASALVSALASQSVSFLVGCAPGVDGSFRQALVPFASRATVASGNQAAGMLLLNSAIKRRAA